MMMSPLMLQAPVRPCRHCGGLSFQLECLSVMVSESLLAPRIVVALWNCEGCNTVTSLGDPQGVQRG